MLRFQRRSFLPIAALLAGSWVGLRSTHPETRKTEMPAPVVRAPPEVDRPPAIDANLLPDPTPWPQLNPAEDLDRAWLLAEGPASVHAVARRLVTFTFDDGPFPETTPVVLHVLEKHHVRAAFFWIGRYLDGDSERAIATRDTARQVAAAGHLVGNHTHDHQRLNALSRAEALGQIDDGAASIERVLGTRPALFRPPYGRLDAFDQVLLRERALTLVLWNIEVEDLQHDDAEQMAASLREQIDFAGGGIVLLHDIRFTTAEALDKLLTVLDQHRYDERRPSRPGYAIVDLPQFLRETAASPQPYPSREALENARAAQWRKVHPSVSLPHATGNETSTDAM
jgi:peptidoglycan/xylan/chitin deacetylase (PgdA/CDA1 family)